jgi:hypothetical protein
MLSWNIILFDIPENKLQLKSITLMVTIINKHTT